MSLGAVLAAGMTGSGSGNPMLGGSNVDPYDLSSLGIHNPPATGRGPGGIPIFSGESGERSFKNPFAADPSKENWNAPFGVPYDQSSMQAPGSINGQGNNPLSGILQALLGNRGPTS